MQFEKPEIPSKPLDILHIDIYSINNSLNLTIIDKFSKFATAYPIESRNSLNIIRSLKHYVSLHGIPKKIICDQGGEFTANIFKDFCTQYDITVHYTSFSQSSSNSPVERLHSTLTETYRIILNKFKENKIEVTHPDILNETIITYNNAIHSSTKFTPYEIFYGRTSKFNDQITFNNEHEYLKKLNQFQQKFYPEIKSQLEKAMNHNIDKLNINREAPKNFENNQTIFRKENRRSKVAPRFKIRKVKANNKATIITKDNQKIHKSKIKRKLKFQVDRNSPGPANGNP
jgi:hypothetical protein